MISRKWSSIFSFILTLLANSALCETVLHRGNVTEPDTLDPHRAGGTWENNIISDLFVGLTTDDAKAEVIPGAAESWTVSEDGLTYTFHLRDGHVWSDGAPVTTHDFVFGFRRIINPQTAARYASLLYPIKNARPANRGEAPLEKIGVKAIDEKTLEITLENPAPFLPRLLSHFTTFAIPAHVVREHGDDWVKPGIMVSNGPYVLAEWRANSYVRVVRNPLFYDAANVAIDEIYFYPIEDGNTALKQFRSGQIDLNEGFPTNQMEWLRENMPDETRLFPNMSVTYLALNTALAPFDDVWVRRAISMTVEREMLVKRILRDGRLPAYSFVPPNVANYVNTARLEFTDWSEQQRLQEARRLLENSGFGPGIPLIFEFSYRSAAENRRVAAAIAGMLRRIGIEAQVQANEARVHYNMLDSKDYAMGDAGWVADYNDAQNFLYLFQSDAGPMNYANYNNPYYDQLMAEADRTLDTTRRAELMAMAEQIMLDESPVIPLFFGTTRMLVHTHVKGYEDNIINVHRSRFMSLHR